jgi:hypothetical protein
VPGDVEKGFIFRCVWHRFPYEWSRGIERNTAVQLATLVGCIKQSAPLWEGWYRTAFSWRYLVWSSIYHAAAPPCESRIKAQPA